jgi:hypothetical protein
MSAFIFVTAEGYTFQPGSESKDPDVENLQVIGFAEGGNPEQAFANLMAEDTWLAETTFDRATCYELRHTDYQQVASYFSIRKAARNAKRRAAYRASRNTGANQSK